MSTTKTIGKGNDLLLELYSKPSDYVFSEVEITFIKSQVPKANFRVKYAIWKQERKNGLYIFFGIDNFPIRSRKAAIDNAIDVVCSRELSDLEYHEAIMNYGCNNRVMKAWYYKTVNFLIEEDLKYGIVTPDKFVKHCKVLGYWEV